MKNSMYECMNHGFAASEIGKAFGKMHCRTLIALIIKYLVTPHMRNSVFTVPVRAGPKYKMEVFYETDKPFFKYLAIKQCLYVYGLMQSNDLYFKENSNRTDLNYCIVIKIHRAVSYEPCHTMFVS